MEYEADYIAQKAQDREKRLAFKRARVKFFARAVFFTVMLAVLTLAVVILSQKIAAASEESSKTEVTPPRTELNEDDGVVPIFETSTPESDDTPDWEGWTVCIDPGHGIGDPGCNSAYSGDMYERDIVYDIATRLKKILEEEGVSVVMTHKNVPPEGEGDDYLFGIKKRVAIVNESGADAFISIHGDAYPEDETIKGTRVYYYTTAKSPAEDYAALMAEKIGQAVSAAGGDDSPRVSPESGVSAYYMIRKTTVPSVLVETGFISNPDDAALMIRADWRQAMAEGMAEGIFAFFGTLSESD